MRLLQGRLGPVTRMDYENAVSHCDKLTARIAKTLVILLMLSMVGCRTTVLGTGQAAQGLGKGFGTVITGVGDFLVKEMNGENE